MDRGARSGRRSPPIATRLRVALVTVAALAGLVVPVGARAGGPELSLDPTSAPPGADVDATGSGYPAGTPVEFTLDPGATVLPTDTPVATDRSGSFAATFTIPGKVSPGSYRVLACTTDPNACASTPFTVTRTTTTTRPTTTTRATTTTTRATTTTSTTDPPIGVVTTTSSTTTSTLPLAIDDATTSTTDAPDLGIVTSPTNPGGPGPGEFSQTGDTPNLVAVDIEVSQTLQNRANVIPLVAERTTIARVYMRTEGGTMTNVKGAMLVDPASGPAEVILADNGPITVTEQGSDRLDIDSTLQFTLPPSGIPEGTTTLTAFVYDGIPSSAADNEPADADNFHEQAFAFGPTTSLAVRLFPIHDHVDGADQSSADDTIGVNGFFDAALVGAMFPAAYRYHPISEIVALPGTTLYPPAHHDDNTELPLVLQHWDPDIDGHMSFFNAMLMDIWEQSTPADDFEQFYGMWRDQPSTAGGLSNYTVANGEISVQTQTDHPWYQTSGGKTMAHEIFHNMGIDHFLCTGSEPNGGPVEPYPFTGPPCRIAPEDPDGFFGLDIAWQMFTGIDAPAVISNSTTVGPPFQATPVMGYGAPRWIDVYLYCRALVMYGIDCDVIDIPEDDDEPSAPVEGADGSPQHNQSDLDFLRVSAIGDLRDGTATFVSLKQVDPLPHALAEHARRRAAADHEDEIDISSVQWTIDQTAVDGRVLTSTPLATLDHADSRDGEAVILTHTNLTALVPWEPDAVTIVLRNDDGVVAERAISDAPPTVEVGPVEVDGAALTVRWSATDPDGDRLRFDVAYSPDGGSTWTALAVMQSATSLTFRDPLPGGDDAVVRVTANDGVRTAFADSPPFVLADSGPQLTILSPAPDAELPTANVLLRASAVDLEDGIDEPPSVTWESDVDGVLGEGTALLSRLRPGQHTVTATAADTAGGSTSASVTFTVVVDPDDPEEVAALEAILLADRAGAASGPGAGTDDGVGLVPWLLGGVLAAVAGAGAWIVLRRRHQA